MGRRHKDFRKGVAQGLASFKYIEQLVALADFTDGGVAKGTLTMDADIPKNSVVEAITCKVYAGFAGDTSADLSVGDGSDEDRFGTANVFATAADGVACANPVGARVCTADVSPVLTVESAADFTSVSAGQMLVRIYFV